MQSIQYMDGSYSLQQHSQVAHTVDLIVNVFFVFQKCTTILDLINYHKKQPIFLSDGESVLLKIGVSKLL